MMHRVAVAVALFVILGPHSSCRAQGLSTTRRVILRYKQGWHQRHLPATDGRLLSTHRQLLDTAHQTLEPHCSPTLHDLHHVELQVWEFPATCNLDAFSSHLISLEHAVEFEHDGVVYATAKQPDDPLFPQQWSMQELRLPYAGPLGSATNDTTTRYTTRTREPRTDPIIITIIDSGVDVKHPDLQGRLWRNPGEIPNNGIDDDLNGLIDDVHGYNFLAETSDVNDDYFHGTHLAGIVGAVCNNEIGVCGINTDGVVIQACKFLDSAGTGLISNAVKCIDYSLKSGAVLTLNSYGGYNQDSPTLRNAINAAERAGQLFITAAGNNDLQDLDATPSYPASSNQTNVVTVAAVDEFSQLAYYSNYGQRTVEFAAPGSNIMSTIPPSSYGTHDGTSQAAGVTAGVIALLLATYRQAGFDIAGRAREVRSMLLDVGVKPAAVLKNFVQTGGMLDVVSALQAVPASVLDVPGYNPATSTLPYLKKSDTVSGQTVGSRAPSFEGVGLYLSDVGSLSNWSVSLAYTGQQTYGLCVRQETPVDILALADAYAEDITAELRGLGGVFTRTLPVGFPINDINMSDMVLSSTGLLLVLPPRGALPRNTSTQQSVSAATVETMSSAGVELYVELMAQAASMDARLTADGTTFNGAAFALLPAAYNLALGGKTSFVAELFYMTSTLPAGSARITVLDSGLPEAVIGAFVGNENLQDADEVELLRQCGQPASLELKPVDSANTISQSPIMQMPLPATTQLELVAAPAQRVNSSNPLYAQLLGLSGATLLAMMATNPGAQLLDAHLSIEPRGANAMSPSLLLSITANSSALRLDPPQLLSNATQTCDGEATCVRQSEKGIVFFSNASTPSLLRVVPAMTSRRMQLRATLLRQRRCDNHTFVVSPLAATRTPDTSDAIVFGFECGAKFLQLPNGRRLVSRDDCAGYGFNALYLDIQSGGTINLWDDNCDVLTAFMEEPFGGFDGAPQGYLYVGGASGAVWPRLELLTGFAPFNASVSLGGRAPKPMLVTSASQAGFQGWQLARPAQYLQPGSMAAASVAPPPPEARAASVGDATPNVPLDDEEVVYAQDTADEASLQANARPKGSAGSPPMTLWWQRTRALPGRASSQLLQQLTTLRLTDRKAASLILQWSPRGGATTCDAELVVRSSFYDQPLWRIPLVCQ